MIHCIYCNRKGHSGCECPEKELLEKNVNVRDTLDEAAHFSTSKIFDSSQLSDNPLWGHSIFSQFLFFSSYSEFLEKEVGENALSVSSLNSGATEFYGRAKDFFLHERLDEAISCSKRSIEGDERYLEATMLCAYCYLEKGELEKADKYLSRAVGLYLSVNISAYILILRARIFQCTGNLKKAIELANEAFKAAPVFFLPHYYLALLYLEEGDSENGFKFLERLEEKKHYLFMGFFIDFESAETRDSIFVHIKKKIDARKEKIKENILIAEKLRDEAKAEEGDIFAPNNFSLAVRKINEVKGADNILASFQDIRDALISIEDAMLYLHTVKNLTPTRKKLTEKAVESFKKKAKRTAFSSGLLLSGWAFVLGGIVGLIRHLTSDAPKVEIIYWAFGISLFGFLLLQANCAVLFIKYKKSFMKNYVESFKSNKGGEDFELHSSKEEKSSSLF